MNKNLKLFFKKNRKVIYLLISFFGAFLLFPIFFVNGIYPLQLAKPLWYSIDSSWIVAFNYFKQQHDIWGKDVAFTYGPLAYLYTRLGWGENKYFILIFDLFIFFNFLIIFYKSITVSKNKLIPILLILIVVLTFPLYNGLIYTLVLFGFFVFWVKISFEDFKYWYYILQISILVLLFYSKFNTGLITFPIFLSGLFLNVYEKRLKIYTALLIAVIPFILIFIFSYFLNIDLKNYAITGFEMVKGYNDVMYLTNQIPNSKWVAILSVLGLMVVLGMNRFYLIKKNLLRFLTSFFIFGLSIFVIFKQAFVRADTNHINDFYLSLPILVLCNLDLYHSFSNKINKFLLVASVILPLLFINLSAENNIHFVSKLSKKNYISGFSNFNNNSGLHIREGNFPLPENVLKKIGKNSVDIYPWNSQLVLENNLNYTQRPVFQSFTAYTPWLENLNFNFYNNDSTAPEFVIYEIGAIDNRYAFFDEPKVNLAFVKNYNIVDEFIYDDRKLVLLQKKKDFKTIQLVKIKEYAMYVEDPILPKDSIYYQVVLYHNLKGKITSMLSHAPAVKMKISITNIKNSEYTTSKTLLDTGFFSDKYINDTQSFINLFHQIDSVPKVKRYYIIPQEMEYFNHKMRVIEYKIE